MVFDFRTVERDSSNGYNLKSCENFGKIIKRSADEDCGTIGGIRTVQYGVLRRFSREMIEIRRGIGIRTIRKQQ